MYAQNAEKITFLSKIVLLFRRRKDSASKTGTLGDFIGQISQKPFCDYGGQGCRIILDYADPHKMW
jgi:hypothetical protein